MTTLVRRRDRFLSALPAYFGGKRRLLGWIFKAMPKPTEAPVLIDGFLGGGAVSLMAKARGYRVVCNDVALRSAIVGKALIANSRVTLSRGDVLGLFVENGEPDPPGPIERDFAGSVIPTDHARFLDRALPRALRRDDAKGALLTLVLLRYVTSLRPLGNFGARTVVKQFDERRWEDVNPSVLRETFTRRVQAHPLAICEELRTKVNAGVFSNGKVNTVNQGDVFAFLAQVEGRVCYLDPPYPGTRDYESALQPLDSILAGRRVHATPSVFSGRQAKEALDRLIECCNRFPWLVLSCNNAVLSPDELTTLVARHRKNVRAEVIRYAHLAALASEESKKRNVEVLISAGEVR